MIGCKIELVSYEEITNQVTNKKVLTSKVYDVLDSNLLQIAMPIYEGKMVPLGMDTVYSATFYTEKGLFECFVKVTSRYKSGQLFCLEVTMLNQLTKVQRRQFFRLDCAIDGYSRIISDEEYDTGIYEDDDNWNNIRIADISGGGVKMYQHLCVEPNEIVLLKFNLPIEEKLFGVETMGRILRAVPFNGRTDIYDHRVEFMNISKENRDNIVKYIFEEQRMKRAKETGFR